MLEFPKSFDKKVKFLESFDSCYLVNVFWKFVQTEHIWSHPIFYCS